MEPARRAIFTEEEYLEREAHSDEKHEYIDGQIVAMSGASPRHNLITGNVVAVLHRLPRGTPCLVLASDQRIQVSQTRLYTYPDVSVFCGRPERHPSPSTLLNPLVLLEVLSESTEVYDRGARFAHYRRLPSLEEYVLVSQAERRIEHYRRVEGEQWMFTETQDGALALPALGIELPLAEVYDKVEMLDEGPGA